MFSENTLEYSKNLFLKTKNKPINKDSGKLRNPVTVIFITFFNIYIFSFFR